MKIEELSNAPQWLKQATTTSEDVEIVNDWVVWHGGTWRGGDWLRGTWRGGDWHGGNWRGGDWLRGTWHGSNWHGGNWHGGTWHGGTWHGGDWHGGNWRGGDWLRGNWRGGTWHGGNWLVESISRIPFMASLAGVHVGDDGWYTGYKSFLPGGRGRYNGYHVQVEGEWHEDNIPGPGAGTCVRGTHVGSMATALIYFGVDSTAELWEVRFKPTDLLDCDGRKCRIRGGVFRKIKWPFYRPGRIPSTLGMPQTSTTVPDAGTDGKEQTNA